MSLRSALSCLLLSCFLFAAEASAEDPIDFVRDVQPILSKSCYSCHGPDDAHREAGLRLDTELGSRVDLDGRRAIVPGKPRSSELLSRVRAEDPSERMPPSESGAKLSADEISVLERWIVEGAEYAEHWSFVPPRRPATPAVSNESWAQEELDRFVLARLDKAGLRPSKEADRYALLRRWSIDLIGLPPSLEEIEAFIADDRPGAAERAVDRLLASPAFGERWARVWLDLARYADSAGYGSDPLRSIWRYRDWVIDAFNAGLTYDRMTIDQLAGDLLPEAAMDQVLATAFHRNTKTNTEGGTDDEEWRVEAIKDRTSTTFQVWMGLTMGCAQCHNHKYDPISQKEYYQVFAIFNQTEDADRGDEAPRVATPTKLQLDERRRNDEEIAGLEKVLREGLVAELRAGRQRWETEQARIEKSAWKSVQLSGGAHDRLVRVPKGSTKVELPLADLNGATGLRLELESASEVGLAEFSAQVRRPGIDTAVARYVRIDIPGKKKILSLAEVEVMSAGQNVARKGKARQSSTDFAGPAKYAIDGNTDGNYQARSVTHTAISDNPWFEVDLGREMPIDEIRVWNRTDAGTSARLRDFNVRLLNESRSQVWLLPVKAQPNPNASFRPVGRVLGIRGSSASVAESGTANLVDGKASTLWWRTPHTATDEIVFEFTEPAKISAAEGVVAELTLAAKAEAEVRLRVSAIRQKRVPRALPRAVRLAFEAASGNRTKDQNDLLDAHYRGIAPELDQARARIAKLRQANASIKPETTPIMRELPEARRRKTHILVKGNFLVRGEEVHAGLPSRFDFAKGGRDKVDRLALAKWLVDRRNPLTARVMINRLWAQLFGQGLVETEEDFGSQGRLPTHPKLLDWLSVEFVDSGWDVKAMLRKIVLSATYRQSSHVSDEVLEKDPRNLLFSRGARFRLDAEAVRDQALSVSGLLSAKMHGPSVFPPQPAGLWQAAFNGQRTWATSMGTDRYRRGLYTFLRRTTPYPSMSAFDAPSREVCAIRRIRTNTPLQAFVTLNDPVFVEFAQALARRIMREGGGTIEERARFGLYLSLQRPPTPREISVVSKLYRLELEQQGKNPEDARRLAEDSLGKLPKDMNVLEAAAWTSVANVLLNLDAALTRG